MNKTYNSIPKEHLNDIVCDMRYDILKMVHNCGKQHGHLGGCMSAVEILAVLYTQVMNINEIAHSDKEWSYRDRFIMSKGHAGIAMYAAMKQVGLVSQQMIDSNIRGENSVLYRHPKRNIEYGIECSVGSLGMGLGYGVGLAETFIRKNTNQKVFVMVGDGECDEGSIWESAAYAGHRKLQNLVVIIDKNSLQLDGFTHDVLAMDNMAQRWNSFGFETVEIDGHNIEEILHAFNVEHINKPLAIIANTVKGKGMSFAENKVEWHDNYLSDELYQQGIKELSNKDITYIRQLANERFNTRKINIAKPKNANSIKLLDTTQQLNEWYKYGSKNIIGEVSYQIAQQDDLFTLIYADCANRIGIEKILNDYPEKCYEVGISEQNQIVMAAAMAHEGYHVVCVAYAPFITARVLDQIRANMGYMKAPLCIIGLGAGIASSDLGATHTSFEDISNIRSIPNILLTTPTDTYEIAKNIEYFCNNIQCMYIRITIDNNDPQINKEIWQYTPLGYKCFKKGEKIAVVTCGSLVVETMQTAKMLQDEGIDISVYNTHCVKPICKELLEKLIEYDIVFTVEEHNVIGGLAGSMSEIFARDKRYPILKPIGIEDCYFYADTAQNIRKVSRLTSQGIFERVKKEID